MPATNAVKPFPDNGEYSGGQVLPQPKFYTRKGDGRWHLLYEEYVNFPKRTVYWEYRRKVLNEAMRLLSGQYNWFIKQDHNNYVTGYKYEFLVDTLRYIATGRRRLDIHTWPMLIADEVESGLTDTMNRNQIRKTFDEYHLSYDNAELIAQWCSHPKGFDDMMFALNLLFGNSYYRIKGNLNVPVT